MIYFRHHGKIEITQKSRIDVAEMKVEILTWENSAKFKRTIQVLFLPEFGKS